MQKKLSELTLQCEHYRARIVELEARLAETGQAELGLWEIIEQSQACLASIVRTATTDDHVPSPPLQRLDRLVFSAGEEQDMPPETKQRVLLALGAKVIVADQQVTISLELPLVSPAPPADGVRLVHQAHQRLRVAI